MLNKAKGGMYDFVDFTWNTVKGACPHGCTYCYMRRFGEQKPVHFDEREMKTDLGKGNFIFVGSSCDMFAEAIPGDWIVNTLTKCQGYGNRYLFQSKNPERMRRYLSEGCGWLTREAVACTTLETNRWYPEIMHNSPNVAWRVDGMSRLVGIPHYITIEPILDFDLEIFVDWIKRCEPVQVNIGADSGNNHLPEPPREKVLALIEELWKFTTLVGKTNLRRLLK
jgi:DNA repair photolyase